LNSMLHADEDDDLDGRGGPRDREISLGTTMLLGIFFALALVCAVFFGFGYSRGSRHAAAAAAAPGDGSSGTNFSSFKPSPSSPLGQTYGAGKAPAYAAPAAIPYTPPAPVNSVTVRTPPVSSQPERASAEDLESAPAINNTPTPKPAPVVAAASTPPAAPPAPTSSVVQIAAVSHQEDADLLVASLKRRGYNVAIRTEPQDRLMHIQVGPFSTRKDAEAMRQRLLADGFNAIVK
jgi:cell division septation protein DedD